MIVLVLIFFNSCDLSKPSKSKETIKNEVAETEKSFALMVKEKGVKKAFLYYASEDAVLNRNNLLVKGKNEIGNYFDNLAYKITRLEWKPDFIDVSDSGDLAYSYGVFVFSAIDTNGKTINSKGIFHTVWKKQKDESWKYVWD